MSKNNRFRIEQKAGSLRLFKLLFLKFKPEQVKLRFIHGAGALRHRFGGVLELGVGDHVAQALRADHLAVVRLCASRIDAIFHNVEHRRD